MRTLASLLVLLLGACSSDSTDTLTDGAGGDDLIAQAVSDGAVSRAELEAIYLGVVDCLSKQDLHGTFQYDLALGAAMQVDVYMTGSQDEGPEVERRLALCKDAADEAGALYATTLGPEVDLAHAVTFLDCITNVYPDLKAQIPAGLPYGETEQAVLTSPTVDSMDSTVVYGCIEAGKGIAKAIPDR